MAIAELIAKRYRIVSELGRGGMATVYRAYDESLGRTVAIKVLHPYLANDEGNRERFRREAQSIARLRDTNIVEVFDFCTESVDRSFIVMEYIEGENLRNWIEHHPSPPPEIALLIGIEICNALKHAHSFGIVHRDIKPENIMVSSVDYTIKLMDFGIAHVVDADTLTATGSLLGSPAHMAPEIIDAEPSDHRTDIFSFGTVIYWLISKKLPFQGTSTTHLLKAILMGEYIPLLSAYPKAGRTISDITSKCMSRKPDDRYNNAADLMDALHAALRDVDINPKDDLLKQYLCDPVSFNQSFDTKIVDTLISKAHLYKSNRNIPAAIDTMNRILAYNPNNQTIEHELESLVHDSSPKWWIAIAILLLLCSAFSISAYYWFHTSISHPLPIDDAVASFPSPINNASLAMIHETLYPIDQSKVLAKHTINQAITFAEASAEKKPNSTKPTSKNEPSLTDHLRPRNTEKPQKNVPANQNPEPQEHSPTQDDSTPSPTTKRYPYRFRVLPAAAALNIDARSFTLGEALAGIPLEQGIHTVEASSTGCEQLKMRIRVSGEQKGEPIPVVLNWLDGKIQVYANEAGVLWIDDDKLPRRFGKNGTDATISIPFGNAHSQKTERKVKLTLAPLDRLQDRTVRRVSIRPGEKTLVNISFNQ